MCYISFVARFSACSPSFLYYNFSMTKVLDNIDCACSRNSAASENEGLPGYL